MLNSSGTMTEGTSANKLDDDLAQRVPQSNETNPGGSASQPTLTVGSNTVRFLHAAGETGILTR
jgi:hypothetical protein